MRQVLRQACTDFGERLPTCSAFSISVPLINLHVGGVAIR